MTQYLLSVIQPDGPIPEPEVMSVIEREVTAVNADMRAAGVWVFSNGLLPPATATVVRPVDGELLVTDGPFAEAKEFLGGFTIVDVPDLDAALEWGKRVAQATTLPIEVRPFAG